MSFRVTAVLAWLFSQFPAALVHVRVGACVCSSTLFRLHFGVLWPAYPHCCSMAFLAIGRRARLFAISKAGVRGAALRALVFHVLSIHRLFQWNKPFMRARLQKFYGGSPACGSPYPRENSPSARVRWGAGAPAKALRRGGPPLARRTRRPPKHASEPSRAPGRRRRIAGLRACRT